MGERTDQGGKHMEYKQKRAIIEGLLDHWQDFNERATSGNTILQEESTKQLALKDLSILSSMSRWPSVIELGRVLANFRRLMPHHYRMLVAYYESDTRLVNKPIKRRDAKGRWVDDVERVRERVLNRQLAIELRDRRCHERDCPCEGLMPRIVCRALDDLLALWRSPCQDPPRRSCRCKWCLIGVPFDLPPALKLPLKEFTDQDGNHWTEAA